MVLSLGGVWGAQRGEEGALGVEEPQERSCLLAAPSL